MMRIRWRDHEILLFALITVLAIVGYCWSRFSLTEQQLEGGFVTPYNTAHLSFNYNINVLAPQAGVALLLFICYLLINWVVVSAVRRVFLKKSVVVFLKRLLWVGTVVAATSFLLAFGVNVATYYAHPWIFSYGNFGLFALFGYNDHPLTNIFDGFYRALALVGIYGLFACLREVVINYILLSGTRRAYRVMVANKVTAFLVLFFAVPPLLLSFNLIKNGFLESTFSTIYFAFILPAFLVFTCNTYWLFPSAHNSRVFSLRIILRLLGSAFIVTFPVVLFFVFVQPAGVFLISWAIQLFVVTPVSWLVYREQKDKILQLRGVEKELAKSKTDLQFLRSQVNPHFLFNTLNTLYGTALQEGSQRTAEGIQKLGDMMRFMLHENNLDFIPMAKEMEYLENYIALQKLRTQSSPNIMIEDNISGQSCRHKIAPMLLIPLVENAFKHGISLAETSWIKITLACDDKNIAFEVKNSMHPNRDSDPEKDKSGIGLKNVKERLALLYPGKYIFRAEGDGQEFIATINIQP